MASHGLSQDQAQVRDRERRAVELRNANYSYWQIAEQVGYASASAARDAIMRCIQRDVVQEVEEIRSVELSKLAAIEQAVYLRARRGDDKAIETLLKIMRERRKYVGGLEAPQQVEMKVEPITEEEWAETINKMWVQYQGKDDAGEVVDAEVVEPEHEPKELSE